MRIYESGDPLKKMIADMKRMGDTRRLKDEFSDEFGRASNAVKANIHEHTGNLKSTWGSFEPETPKDFWEGVMSTTNPDAARAAHWEMEKGGDHNFMKPVDDDTFFGRAFEEKLDSHFWDTLG